MVSSYFRSSQGISWSFVSYFTMLFETDCPKNDIWRWWWLTWKYLTWHRLTHDIFFFLHIEFLVCVASKTEVSTNFENLEKDFLAAYGLVGNFHAYLITGFTHTFTNKDYYNTTDPSGKTPSPPTPPGGCVMLDTWLNALITKGPSDSMCSADTSVVSSNFCPDFIPSCNTLPTATPTPVHNELR